MALDLSAGSSAVNLGRGDNSAVIGTVIMWVKLLSATADRVWMNKAKDADGSGFIRLGTNSSDAKIRAQMDFVTQNADAISDTALSTGVWYYVAANWNTTIGAPRIVVGTESTRAAEVGYTGTPVIGIGSRSGDSNNDRKLGYDTFAGTTSPIVVAFYAYYNTTLSIANMVAHQFVLKNMIGYTGMSGQCTRLYLPGLGQQSVCPEYSGSVNPTATVESGAALAGGPNWPKGSRWWENPF